MPDPLDSVNTTAATYRRLAGQPDANADSVVIWLARAADFDAVAEELTRLRAWAKPVPASYGDVSDLPPELLAQLSLTKTDELEDQIHAIVKASEDGVELDRLLIELYRRHGDVHQRRFIMNKAYRMTQKGLIHTVGGRKGVYTVKPPAKAEAIPDAPVDEGGGFRPATPPAPATFDNILDDDVFGEEEEEESEEEEEEEIPF